MATADNIKNAKAAAKAAEEVAKDFTKSLSFGKALFQGQDSKINNTQATLMVALAFVIDLLKLLSILTGVGDVVAGVIAQIIQLPIFTLWFWLLGTNYWTTRAMASKIADGAASLIPVIGEIVPETLIDVGVAVAYIRMEEYAAREASKETPSKDNVRTFRKPGADTGIKNPKNSSSAGNPQQPNNVLPFRARGANPEIKTPKNQTSATNPPQELDRAA